jgi:hypothetical protein
MQVQWYQLSQEHLPAGVVFIDATKGAERLLREGFVLSILEDLWDNLPATLRPEVGFLGGRRSFTLLEVIGALSGERVEGAAVDLDRELGRFPVVGPGLREWIRAQTRPVVLLTNTRILDLDDWTVPEVVMSLLVYRLTGYDRLTPTPFREVGTETDLGVLVEHLRDSVLEWTVGDSQVFVVDWDVPDLVGEDGTVRRKGGKLEAVSLLLAHAEGHLPQATFRRASGTTVKVRMIESQAHPKRPAIEIPHAETIAIDTWRGGRPFWCAECRGHTPGQFWCGNRADKATFPSLAGTARGTAWAFKFDRRWLASPAPNGIVILDGQAVVNRNGEWKTYAYDDGRWSPTDELKDRLIKRSDDEFLIPG